MSQQPNRRGFIATIGIGAAAAAVSCTSTGSGGQPQDASIRGRTRPGPNDRIGLGIIGVGDLGSGGHHLGRVLQMDDIDVIAVADVDGEHVDRAVTRTEGRATGYRDYRQLLDRQDIDAVIIVTPDHWHALPAVDACNAGVDVYCEKPLSLTVADGQAMVAAARRNGTVFQTGTQQRSDRNTRFRMACELVRNGVIGELHQVKVVLGRGPVKEFEVPQKTPIHLDWNTWLGPAPVAAYHQNRCHYEFRWFYDYSGGKMTDWGAHHLDIAQWGIGTELSGPVAVEGTGTFPEGNFYETAVDFDVHYEYGNGVKLHATGAGENGVTFTGSEGEVFVSRGEIWASRPEILEYELGSGEVVLYESLQHHRNWVDCMRSREKPISDVEIGHRSASVCHLGNIAIKLGRKLRWNPDAEQFVGDAEANGMVRREYRSPWSLPAPS